MDRSIGGNVHLTPSDLSRPTSDNGQYSWGLQSYSGDGRFAPDAWSL